MIANPSGTVCWPGGARGLHTSPDCDRTCLCCSCDSHCFVPPAMETRFKTTVGDLNTPASFPPKITRTLALNTAGAHPSFASRAIVAPGRHGAAVGRRFGGSRHEGVQYKA